MGQIKGVLDAHQVPVPLNAAHPDPAVTTQPNTSTVGGGAAAGNNTHKPHKAGSPKAEVSNSLLPACLSGHPPAPIFVALSQHAAGANGHHSVVVVMAPGPVVKEGQQQLSQGLRVG
ncbi:hypothetical protein HaLaN_15812 [Haematococcus lacustris]|uniref:Uncharacterized protein n=1 Tax=Haematococcus lacustris TaxID=44745 RepID=A0A699ZJE6_HAELA|nr:hypothetical protein HaLaN_15812 [Haematococcus lacustris]